MKSKKLLLFLLTLATISTSYYPHISAYASTTSITSNNIFYESDVISPRYRFIDTVRIAVTPSSSGSSYLLAVQGPDITSTSGTLTLYKKNILGVYYKVDSTKVNETGNSFRKTGTLKSDGSGNYKIEFIGNVYAGNSSESVTISATGSY